MKKILVLFFISFFLISCGSKKNDEIKLQLTLSPQPLTDFLYLNMNYSFQLSEKFKQLDKNYKIYVHFWRAKSKEIILQDDHNPPKETKSWQPQEQISYSRTVFVPKFINEYEDLNFEGSEDVKISIGLYDPENPKERKIELYQEKLKFEPVSNVAPEIIYDEGWYELESNPSTADQFEKTWRWTARSANCIIENHKKDLKLIIKGGVPKSVFPDQKVTIKINGNILEEFIPETARFEKEYILSADKLGNSDEFNLTFETDKTFIPEKIETNSKDNRELGFQIFMIYVREK